MIQDRVNGMTQRRPIPTRYSRLRLGLMSGWDAAIVIPAKDEAKRLRACLDAAAAAIRNARGLTVGIVLVVNNTTDRTPMRAFEWAAGQHDIPFVLIVCTFSAARAGVGAARRLGLDTACGHVSANGALMTTDADTLVRPDWVTCNLSELHGADLICGTVLGRADEARALPAEIAAHGSAESDYLSASIELVARLDPLDHDPIPAHHNAAGASMAVSRRVYEAVGGLPVLALCEDRAFAALVDAHDFRTRFSDTAIVDTSCRMTGRTTGGLAGALRARVQERDPLADEWLEAAGTLALRHGLRGRLRACWPNHRALHRVLADSLGPRTADRIMKPAPGPHFGAFFDAAEAQSPRLARHRLRLSDCRRELPKLNEILCQTDPVLHRDPTRAHSGAARQATA